MKPGIISAIAESCCKIARLHRFILHLGESNIASQKLCAAVEMFIAHERKILAPIPHLTPIYALKYEGSLLLQTHHNPYIDVGLIIMDWNFYKEKPKSWWECSSLYESKWYSLQRLMMDDYINQGFCCKCPPPLTKTEWMETQLFHFLSIRGLF